MADSKILDKPTVVIVGAGLAGLAAAAKLVKSQKFNIKVLEAADRPGGRVSTSWELCKTADDFPIELGANFIHGNQGNCVFELAMENKLLKEESTVSSESATGVWYHDCIDGVYYTENGTTVNMRLVKEAVEIYEQLCERYNTCLSGNVSVDPVMSLGDVTDKDFPKEIKKLGLTEGKEKQMLDLMNWIKKAECLDNACDSIYDMSFRCFGRYTVLPGRYYTEMGKGGYISVVNTLLEILSAKDVVYNKEVKCIHWNGVKGGDEMGRSRVREQGSGIGIECHDGDWIVADHVLVTCSLGYLKENIRTLFNPPVPLHKAEAIHKLGFGTVDKIFLCFEKAFWDEEMDNIQFVWSAPESTYKAGETQTSPGGSGEQADLKKCWFQKITGFEAVCDDHDNVLLGWIYGNAAEYMETLDEQEVGETCVRLLRQFTGKDVPNVEKVIISRWKSNPYVRGSYSYFAVGSEGPDQDKLIEPLYFTDENSKQIPQVLFAGEATSQEFISTAHGSFSSGEREANRLIKHYETEIA